MMEPKICAAGHPAKGSRVRRHAGRSAAWHLRLNAMAELFNADYAIIKGDYRPSPGSVCGPQ
jgi:hypothetical protein